MARRLILITFLLALMAGCSEDSHRPLSRDLVLQDLRLSVQLSAKCVERGDTLLIELTAFNPYSKPLDVMFGGYGCKEWFWVYDEQGELVSPHQICLDSRPHEPQENFHMEPMERLRFTHEWAACGVGPGHCTLLAGFNAPLDGSPHIAGPVKLEILPRDENVTGEWFGAFIGSWRGSIWGNEDIAMILAQEWGVVSGTFSVADKTFQIEKGLMQSNKFSFSVSDESLGVVVEFAGDVCRGRMTGHSEVLDAATGEVLDDMFWWVYQVE